MWPIDGLAEAANQLFSVGREGGGDFDGVDHCAPGFAPFSPGGYKVRIGLLESFRGAVEGREMVE